MSNTNDFIGYPYVEDGVLKIKGFESDHEFETVSYQRLRRYEQDGTTYRLLMLTDNEASAIYNALHDSAWNDGDGCDPKEPEELAELKRLGEILKRQFDISYLDNWPE